jgi:hypothetical protein
VLRAIVGKFGDKLAEVCPELLAGDCSSLDGLDLEVESMDLEVNNFIKKNWNPI